jgi:ATP-dependent Clp endopeptidase proteolytic subunit ClpP
MSTEWNDSIRSRLLSERVVSLFGRLDDSAVSDLAAQLWSLDALGDEPIELLLSVSGGTVNATSALVDVLDVVGVEIAVTCVGGLVGPPVGLLGAVGKRRAAPSARFILRDEEVRLEGSYRDLDAAVRQHHHQRHALLSRIAASTNGRQSLGDVLADFERGRALGADDALRYGLIDEIALPRQRGDNRFGPTPGFGFRPS